MKKFIVSLLFFFCFIVDASALTTINKMDVDVAIDETGVATVTEVWQMPKQNSGYINKKFNNSSQVELNDLSIIDSNNHNYTNSSEYKNKLYHFYLSKKGGNNYLNINTDGTDKNITLSYKVEGMIKSYKDLDGINWYFIDTANDMEIKKINIQIHGIFPYNESNVGLYGIGNNIECNLKDGKIILSASNLGPHNKILLLSTFADARFAKTIKINDSFSNYYKHNKPSVLNDIRNFLASETVIILLTIVIIIIILVILRYSIGNKKSYFDKIKISSKINFNDSLKNASYYELPPCDANLYRLEFIASFFKITKNRSNMISAVILKWIYNGYAEMNIEEKTIKIKENLKFNNPLDQQLYAIIKESSGNYEIRKNTLNNYADKHHDVIDKWFFDIYIYVMKTEYELGNIRIANKKIIIKDNIVKSANELMGLKKYLLNFNQVPRSSELTPNIYEDLLVCSCLLGVSTSLAKEILRKNKDNSLAHTLEDFCTIRQILLPTYSIKSNKVDFIKSIKE